MMGLNRAYMHAKFDHHSSFNRSGDMVGYNWSLYLYPLQRYERWYKI